MPLQKEGVVLAVEGATQFINQLKSATGQYEQFIGSLSKGEGQAATMGSGLGKLGGAAGAAKGAIGGLSVGVIAAGAAVAGAAIGVKKLTDAVVGLAKETAPLQGIMLQFATTAQDFVGGGEAMLESLRKVSAGTISSRELMLKYNQAAALVSTQFANEMPKALGLIAKVSAATGRDMNYLFESYIYGIGRLTPRVLDNLYIQISVAEATEHATKMFGKQEDALTTLEKQTAYAELATAKLEEKFGAMPDLSQFASGQMAILNANFQNIKDTLGQFLLPAFSSFLQGLNALVGAFSAAISEGGAFYPILVNVGAALSIAADGFKALAERGAEWINNLSTDWAEGMGGIAQSAIQWGANIVTNFAVGIIDAANTVLTWAMQQIQNILLWWLGPGSPPRVAPNLDKWGLAAFEEYLRGMTEADFGVLESIQGPLKRILSGPAFADVSKEIAKALAGGDRAGALAALTESSKVFGDDIAELARREFALADATTAVEEAELALAAARDRASATNRKVSEQTREYNRLLRAGASKEVLDAQLKRINASEEEARAAQKDVGAAEKGLDAAKDRVDVLKEQVEWQRRFLEQLFGISDALSEEERAEARAAAGRAASAKKGAGAIPGVEKPTLPGGVAGGIGGAIAKAIEDAKGRIKEALSGIWETIKSEFSERWNAAIAELGETWDTFVSIVGGAWDRLKERWPFLQDVEDWIVGLPEKIATMISTGWDLLQTAMGDVWSFVETYLLPILKDLVELGLLVAQVALIELTEKFAAWLDEVQVVWSWIKETFLPFVSDDVTKVLNALKDATLGPLIRTFERVKQSLVGVHKWLGWVIDKIKQWISLKRSSGLVGHSPSPLAIGIQTAADAMERMARVSVPQFQHALAFQSAGAGTFYRPAGATYNSQANSFNFNTTVGNGLDAAGLEAMILRTVRRALATGA